MKGDLVRFLFVETTGKNGEHQVIKASETNKQKTCDVLRDVFFNVMEVIMNQSSPLLANRTNSNTS